MPPVFKRVSDGLFRYRPAGVDTQVTNFPNALLVTTNTDTGAQNDWAPALSSHTLIEWSGASNITVTGLAGGSAGQRVVIKNTGTKVATFAHASASSVAANRFTNIATSAPTPVAANGFIAFIHDGTNWKLESHEQGSWITPTFAAGDYSAWNVGSWTVASATTQQYWLRGTQLFRMWAVSGTTAGSPLAVTMAMVGGFTPVSSNGIYYVGLNGAGVAEAGYYDAAFAIAGTPLACLRFGNIAFGNGTVTVYGSIVYTVT